MAPLAKLKNHMCIFLLIKRERTMNCIKLHENCELTLVVFDYYSFKFTSIIINNQLTPPVRVYLVGSFSSELLFVAPIHGSKMIPITILFTRKQLIHRNCCQRQSHAVLNSFSFFIYNNFFKYIT